LIHESIGKKFIESLKDWASKITGGDCFQDKNYARIISKRHFDRLKDLMEKQLKIKETVLLYGGATREVDNCIEPTILLLRGENIHNQPIMKDEIFGPILPVIFYKDLNEALSFVKKVYGFDLHSGKNPLALYPFSRNDSTLERIISEINAGMVTTNDVLMQGQILNFPFGGTGNSGIGAYHGIHSLKAFTRPLGILKRVVATDIANMPRYRLIYHSKVAFKMIKYFLVTPLQSDFSTKTKFYLWKYGIPKFSFYMFLVLFGYYYGKNY
jgi:aldehyde dehydrogenase (NAD+)